MQKDDSFVDGVLQKRLASFLALSDEEKSALTALAAVPSRRLDARRDLVREGDTPRTLFLIAEGWACRYKTLEDGRRQIVGILLPGDLCDLNNLVLSEMDHSIGTLSAIRYLEIPHEQVARVTQLLPRLGRAFWWQILTNFSIQREWILNVGQRNAIERIGHLFCELQVRLTSVGLAERDGYDLPITQIDIADATGLTPVHVNRTVQEMRARGLISLSNRHLGIPDWDKLRESSMFNPAYLHLHNQRTDDRGSVA